MTWQALCISPYGEDEALRVDAATALATALLDFAAGGLLLEPGGQQRSEISFERQRTLLVVWTDGSFSPRLQTNFKPSFLE
jgi:hypothetical protein